MNFTIIIFIQSFIYLLGGYYLSSILKFKNSRLFRIISYFLILFISVITTHLFAGQYYSGYVGISACLWFYYGTRIKNDIPKKLIKAKFVFGVIEYIIGGINILVWIMDVFFYSYDKTSLNYNSITLLLGISQILFAYSLTKTPKK
tara:strand:+ start:413 stop:850 length:438 start_codon:yes stop_codon:yes gene_type:complete